MEKNGVIIFVAFLVTAVIALAVMIGFKFRVYRRNRSLTAEAGLKIRALLDEMLSLMRSDGPITVYVCPHKQVRNGKDVSVKRVMLLVAGNQEYKLSLTTLLGRKDELARVSITKDINDVSNRATLTFWPVGFGHREPDSWLLDRLRTLEALVKANVA